MVVDVRVARASGDAAGVGQTVRLDFIRYAQDKPARAIEVGDGVIETADREVSMPTMTKQLVAVGMSGQSVGIDGDRLVVATEIGQPPAEPDDRPLVPGRLPVTRPGQLQLLVATGTGRWLQLRAKERRGEK